MVITLHYWQPLQPRQLLELLPCQQQHLVKDLHCVLHYQILNFDLVKERKVKKTMLNFFTSHYLPYTFWLLHFAALELLRQTQNCHCISRQIEDATVEAENWNSWWMATSLCDVPAASHGTVLSCIHLNKYLDDKYNYHNSLNGNLSH